MKRFAVILSLFVLTVGAAICVFRWDVWFSTPTLARRAASLPYVWTTAVEEEGEYAIVADPDVETLLRLPDVLPDYLRQDSVPENGPRRFLGRSYYCDYPTLRFVYLDVDNLRSLSSYLVLETWLSQVLRFDSAALCDHTAPNNRWTVVLMSQSVTSAVMNHWHPLNYAFFRRPLYYADLVIAGGDYVYSRNRYHNLKHILSSDIAEWTTPVYTTLSTTSHSRIPSCRGEERLGVNAPYYVKLRVTPDTLFYAARRLSDEPMALPYDSLTFIRANRLESSVNTLQSLLTSTSLHHFFSAVQVGDSLAEEVVALPLAYQGSNNWSTRRFINRLRGRQAQPEKL